jgi:uncharacterized protein with von Willebrand factor type A (vWA) domain
MEIDQTDPPAFDDARDHVVTELVRFARTLRADGASVPADATLAAARAVVEVGLGDRAAVRAATHATMVTSERDSETFAGHFPSFWHRLRSGLEAVATAGDVGTEGDADGRRVLMARTVEAGGESVDADDGEARGAGGGDDPDGDEAARSHRVADGSEDAGDRDGAPPLERATRMGTYSGAGEGSAVEDGEAALSSVDPTAVDRLVRALSSLPGRRTTPARAGPAIDVRRTRRRSLATGGVPVELEREERAERALSACVLVDVSRSVLDAVDRGVVLSFLSELVAAGRTVRVFFFDTEVREVTDAFAESGDPLSALTSAEVAWGGGTRIGDSLSALRRRWPDAVDRRTVTLVVSDGLDVGDVDVLDREMVRLSRRGRATLWFNPLAVSTAYRPTCRGMAAALPSLDGLFAFGGTADLTEAAAQIERRGLGGPLGYQYDFRDRDGTRERGRDAAAGGASA